MSPLRHIEVALLVAAVATAGLSRPASADATDEKADSDGERAAAEERTLSARDISRTLAPWRKDVSACYRRHGLHQKRATGELRLELLIEPEGGVRRLRVVAPGVRGKKLDRCLQAIGARLSFPSRSGFTRAAVPYRFVKTRAPGAGPRHSCWKPGGCSRGRAAKGARAAKR